MHVGAPCLRTEAINGGSGALVPFGLKMIVGTGDGPWPSRGWLRSSLRSGEGKLRAVTRLLSGEGAESDARGRAAGRISVGADDDGAQLVELLDFGGRECAIVGADVVVQNYR